MARVLEKLSLNFIDPNLFETVFVHASFLNEKEGNGLASNERLEFLGDAVLSSVISHILFERFSDLSEGELTRLRSRLVNKRTLAGLAKGLDLGECLLLGRGERRSQGAENSSILADTFEALLAAVYLDQGYQRAYQFVEEIFVPLMDEATDGVGYFDFKPMLQELTQRLYKKEPVYALVKQSGPAHKRLFVVKVTVGDRVLGQGQGTSKKAAEQMAAQQALEELKAQY